MRPWRHCIQAWLQCAQRTTPVVHCNQANEAAEEPAPDEGVYCTQYCGVLHTVLLCTAHSTVV